jgi:hypothetical protein
MWLCSSYFFRRRLLRLRAVVRRVDERLLQQVLNAPVFEIADRDDHEVRRDVRLREVFLQRLLVEGADALRGAEDRPAERMVVPEALGENLVDQIVGRVLDHLDLFEDHLLFALDVFFREQRVADQVREDLDRERQVLVEHLGVVAGVFLRRERVDLAADRIDLLRDLLGVARRRALEEHVLDEVRDAGVIGRLVARAARQPDADGDRPHVRHPLGGETDTVGKHGSTDIGCGHVGILPRLSDYGRGNYPKIISDQRRRRRRLLRLH